MPIGKVIVGIVLNVAIFGGLLFGPAGTWAWGRAWVFLGVVLVTSIASIVPLLASPALLKERFTSPIQQGQPFADKIILLVFIAGFCGVVVSIPLDVFRWHLLARRDRSGLRWACSCSSGAGRSSRSPCGRTPLRLRWSSTRPTGTRP